MVGIGGVALADNTNGCGEVEWSNLQIQWSPGACRNIGVLRLLWKVCRKEIGTTTALQELDEAKDIREGKMNQNVAIQYKINFR